MKRYTFIRILLRVSVMMLVLFSSTLGTSTRVAATPSMDVISIARFHDDSDFLYVEDIQALLEAQDSVLANYYVYFPISDTEASAANIIAGAALRDNLNPTVLLTLIEIQTQLISTQPDSLDALLCPFGQRDDLPEGFAAQVWAVSEQLNRDFVRYAVEGNSLMAAAESATEVNPATSAIQTHLGDDASDFASTYTALFGDNPTGESTIRAQSDLPIALTSPYEGAYDEEITSLFDHEYPTYEDGSYITLWTGENIPGATFWQCESGYNCYTGHDSYDYGIEADSNILAAADGLVVDIGPDCAGIAVTVAHAGGYRTQYWHLHQPLVELNQQVSRGEIIGLSGGDQGGCSTGSHLHFNVTLNNEDTDPFGWEGNYPEPCVVEDVCAPGQFLWATEPITPTATPTATLTPTPTATPTPIGTPTPIPTAYPGSDSYEPDGDSSLANPIMSYYPQTHSIVPVGDRDWVTFTLDQYSAIVIWTNGETDADTEMTLYDANLTLIDQNDDYVLTSHYSRIERTCNTNTLPPGQYYVEVAEADDATSIESYLLQYVMFTCTGYPTPTPDLAPQVFVPLINANGGEVIIAGAP